MNRIYNVIWSKTKKCYVVVSEIVKSSGGKVKSLHTGKTYTHMSTVMAVAALLAGVNITSVNAAAIMIDGVNAGYATAKNGGNQWSYLYNYNNPGNMSALDGTATTGYYSGSALNGISIGHNTKIQEASDPTYYSGVAIGDYAQATGGLSFSLGNYAQSTKPSAMAIGTASLSSGFNSLAMMRQSAATGNFSTAIGTTSWASGTGSFALGYSAQSKGDQSIAIGAAEPITVPGSGNEPSAAYNGTTNTVTEGARSLAFGTKARTTAAATDSMAFGSNAKTKAANAVAMGNSSRATGTDSFAFGNTASAAGTNAIAMGRTAQASKANAIALGGQAKALEANALAIGSTAEASKAGTMAIGTASKASSNNSTAIGNGAEVTGENSMALGSGAKISSNNSIALGAGTEFNDPLVSTYAAFTNEMNPAEAGVVAVGNSSTPRRIVNVAGGQNDNDAATIKQLRYVNNNLAMTIAGPTYTGYEANGSTYKAPDFNIKNSTYHTVKEAVEAAQTNFFSAKGTSADANYDNKGATGTNATAAGVRASAAGNFGTALGADATATSEKGTALGYNAKVTEDDGVALGSNSVANTAAGVAGYDVSVADNRANRYTDLTGSVATSTLGAVSVGQSTSVGTETRQITNLAAGKKDTDAVNVAQLRNVNLKIAGNTNDNNGKNDVLLDKQTLTVKGDGTYVTTKANNQTIDVTLTNDTKDKIDNAANKDLSNITNVGKKNITALGTIVEAGHNVTIPAATVDTTTGQKTYTVNAMDTKVSLGTSGLMTLTGGTPDANGVRNYTVDVDPTKVAKTDLSNINNDGKTVIREEAQKAVKVIAGQNTTVTEGTDGTYKTYAVNVASAEDYRLVENSAAADKAYTVTGNKVDLTVQDGSTPANTKTVTIKDIASKTELDSTKSELTTKINDTKTELSNKIDDTKTDLINTGLKFDADNNDVKTNKLGSKVTVAGDANITTKITQTGDDSTIAVALNKDLNVKTVTATDTVKAGTTTAGSQTATDNKGGTQTGNFITGLDNTAWNMADPVFVSGRAATEDQLKKVSDAVRAANAGSSDYRLIENDAATDKAYTVTGNKVDLKVKDDKSGTTNTVTIKDIASKTEFDKLNDRAVKYDVDGSGNVDKSKVTYEGPTYNSTNKSGGTHVTNVAYATGNDGSEAVNVDYLTDKIKDSSEALINKGMKFDANVGGVQTNKLGSTVKVQGEGAEADANYSGKNIKTFIKQDTAGNTTIDVKMNKNLEVETVTATGANGKDGKIGINGKDGVTTNLSITRDGQPGVDGAAGATTTRIVYEKPDGTKEEVATLNDGLKFKGDMGATSNVKLNKQVDVTGGVTNAADLATGNNIGVTSAAVDANGNAKLQLQLAKDITGLKSVTATDTVKAGTATVGNQTATDNKGGTQTGNFVTGLDNTNWNMTDPVFVPGRAATEDQLKTVSDAVKAASASSSDYRLIENDAATDKAYTVTGNKVDLKVKDDKSGTTKTVTIKDIASKTELDKLDDRAVKYDLDPATNTADKSKVTYEGPTYNSTNKTGGTHVTNVAYATGNNGSEAVNVDYLTDKIKDSSDALINKGLKFDANVGGVQTNKLGSTITVQGEGTEADANYSGENIKTFIKQNTTTGNTTIDVKLNKNLVADSIKINKDGKDGKDGVSITGPTGVAGQDGNNGKVGITGADGKDAVSISGKDGVGHIGLTGPAGTNGINGTNGIDMSVKNGYDDAAKGVKGEKGVDGVDGITRIVYTDNTGEHQVATMDDGMLYGGDTGTVIKKKLNNQVNVKGGITAAAKLSNEDNIGVVADGTDTLMLRLAKDLKGLNSATFNNGTDGNTVVNGGGLTINDAAGNPLTSVTKDGVVITDGPSMTKDGIDASDKKITNVADGTIGAGSKDAVNGGQLHTVVEDLKTKGFGLTAEDGASVKKSLGDTVTVKGDGTNITTSVDNGAVKVALARDLNVDTVTANTVTTGDTKMDTNGVTIKDGANEATKLTKDGLQINDGGNKAVTIDKDGLTIENGPKVTKDGINAGDKKITNVEDGTIAAGSKDAVNGGQLHTAMEDIKAQGFGLKAEDGQFVKKPLGEVIDLKGDGNIKTSVDGTAIKMSLNDTITLGTDPAKQVKVDGSTGTITAGNGANQVTIDGSTGSVTAGNTVKAGDVIMGNQSSGGQNGNFVTGLDNKTWNPNNPVAVTGRAATEDQLKAVNDDFNEKAKNGRVFQGDQAGNDGKVVRGLGDTMNLKGGADVNRLSDNNLAVVKNAAGDGYDIKLAKDLNLKDGSTTYTKTVPGTNTTIPYTVDTKVDGGGITITPSINGQPVPGHTVSLTENGLNNGNNTITNVAPGINGTDAVNVNQLRNAMHSVDGKIADVGAASAAMAGLKPLQYDPLEPTQVLAAVGNYKGSTAAAIGIAHYTNESTMLHMGVSLGGHDNMVNAGVSYKFGTSDAKKAIPARYKAGPISSAYVMQDEVAALKAENLRMKQRDEELSAKYEQVQRDNEEMKAQIAMLMKQAGLTK